MAKSVSKRHATELASSPPQTPEDQDGASQSPILNRVLIAAGWIAMLAFTFHACTRMVAAGDTWVAMACGRHFLNHGVDTVEPFSANSHHAGPTLEDIKRWPTWAKLMVDVAPAEIALTAERVKEDVPWLLRVILPKFDLATIQYWHPTGWVNQNWLTHVIFYWLTTTLGSEETPYFDALVFWKVGLYIFAALAIYAIGRQIGLYPLPALMSACFALYIGRSFLDVRPAGFSNLLVALFILTLALASRRKPWFVWLIVPLAVFWCNVHGGYIYVFIMLAPFVGFHAMAALPSRWTPPIYLLLGWLFLAKVAGRLMENPVLSDVGPSTASFVFILLLGIGLLVAVALVKRNIGPLYASYLFSLLVVFVVLFSQLFPGYPPRLTSQGQQMLDETLSSARIHFLLLYGLFVVLGIVLSYHKAKLLRLSPSAIGHAAGAGVVAFVAVVLFNPFHFTNLTHTIEISVSEHAERWRQVHEWHEAFDWTNPVGTAVPFLILFILAWAALLSWLFFHNLAGRRASLPGTKSRQKQTQPDFEWPQFDLTLMVIGALTIYMAIRSRRFIPIAAFAACPLIMLLVQQTMEAVYGMAGRANRGIVVDKPRCRAAVTSWFAALLALIPLLHFIAANTIALVHNNYLAKEYPITGFHTFRESFCWFYVLLMFVLFITMGWLVAGMWRDRVSHFAGDRAVVLAGRLKLACVVLVALNVIGFSGWFSMRFKRIYLDPWPPDPQYSSVFMRMTASFYKPFNACRFMRQNKLSGKMMNYWTEGGFIGWGQDPDPDTGKTPLQLFMDGRAQAAYDRKAFDQWHQIWGGGPVAAKLQIKRKSATHDDYVEMGQWVSEVLRKRDVWVALVPQGQFDRPFCRALERNSEWPIVFINNKQKLFVDVKTEKGRALFNGVLTGQTVYPDEFCRTLNLGRHHLMYDRSEGAKKKGLDFLIDAYELNPTPAPVIETLTWAVRYPALQTDVTDFCQRVADDFLEQKDLYLEQDGYRGRLESARMSLTFLASLSDQRKRPQESAKYRNLAADLSAERDKQGREMRW